MGLFDPQLRIIPGPGQDALHRAHTEWIQLLAYDHRQEQWQQVMLD